MAVARWHDGTRLRLRVVEIHHLRPGRLLQGKLIIPQRLVDFQLQHVEGDVVLLAGPKNLDARGKADAIPILIAGVAGIGRQIALLIVNVLAMRLQIGAAENDLAESAQPFVRFRITTSS